jgi:hypothetical protein
MSTDLSGTIQTNSQAPASVTTPAGTAVAVSIPNQIAADRYAKANAAQAVKGNLGGIQRKRLIAPSATGIERGAGRNWGQWDG